MKKEKSLFKPSNSNNGSWNLLKTLFQTSIFWLVFLYLLPQGILLLESKLEFVGFQSLSGLGWMLFLFFSMLGVYSGFTMSWLGKGTPLPLDCPNQLVIQGPYKYVRNPMAVAGIGQGLCVGMILGSYLVIIYTLIGAVLWHIIVRPVEEEDLENRFGEAYIDYKKDIKCWIPSLK